MINLTFILKGDLFAFTLTGFISMVNFTRVLFLAGYFCLGDFGFLVAQTFPGAVPSHPAASSLSIPKNINTNIGFQEIPYLEELKQIQSLKSSYDSLKNKFKEFKRLSKDSTLTDSVLIIAKTESSKILDQEDHTLNKILTRDDIPDEELKNAVAHTLEGVKIAKQNVVNTDDVSIVEALMDTKRENLKALTNEWIMPKVERQFFSEYDHGNMTLPKQVPDIFDSDGLSFFESEGLTSEQTLKSVKEKAIGEAKHISKEYIQQQSGDFRKLEIDSLKGIVVTKKEKESILNLNSLKDKKWFERTGLYLWYDPLTSFGEGFYLEPGFNYAITQEFMVFSGAMVKFQFSQNTWPQSVGKGVMMGVRFSKQKWILQGSMGGSEVELRYPKGFENMNYHGNSLSSWLGLGRKIVLGSNIHSVVLAGWDPLYSKGRSLAASPVQVKIGFELGCLSPFKGHKKLIRKSAENIRSQRFSGLFESKNQNFLKQ